MSKTVAELVAEAMARIESVSPKDASVEVAAGSRWRAYGSGEPLCGEVTC